MTLEREDIVMLVVLAMLAVLVADGCHVHIHTRISVDSSTNVVDVGGAK